MSSEGNGENLPCFVFLFRGRLERFPFLGAVGEGVGPQYGGFYEADLIHAGLSFSQGVANWREVRIEHLSEWLASLTEDAYAVASLSRKLSAVRMLAKYMVGEGFSGRISPSL